jgi:hypothetical protein
MWKDLATVVESYVNAAIERAEVATLESGTLVATVPGCPGIVATGADVHQGSEELYHRLEQRVLISLARSQELPVIAGIDLNTEANRTLATYHSRRVASAQRSGDVFWNEAELEAAFEEMDRSP